MPETLLFVIKKNPFKPIFQNIANSIRKILPTIFQRYFLLLATLIYLSNTSWQGAYRNSWTRDASVGRWTLDTGLWTLDSGRWTLDAGLWTLDSGRWTLDAGLWMLDSGRWILDSALSRLDVGCYTLDVGLWELDTIIDCFRTKSEASFWFCLIKLLKILWVWISKDLMVTLAL